MPTYAQNRDPAPTQPPGSESTQGVAPTEASEAARPLPLTGSTPDAPTAEAPEVTTVLATLGKYELLAKIAVGGMGVIYRARDTILNRTVALKTIRAGLLAQPAEIKRFYTEARAVAQLLHTHIIRIYDIAEHGGQHFFTMDFAAQGSVARQRQRYAENPREAVGLVLKVARAVHYAHERSILHRDLKPSNILLDEHDEPLVSDFGLAKFLEADVEQTQEGQLIGTPAYMAPEQAAGRSDQIGPRTDVWALGVILYELLTGQRPFSGKTREEMSRLILDSNPLRPSSVQPLLDRDLETIILKCLEKESADRYASAEALAVDLERWLNGEVPLAQPVAWPQRTWRRVRRAFVPLAAVVLVLFFALFVVQAFQGLAPTDSLTPEQHARHERREEIRRALAAGKDVVLVGAHGKEVTYPWKSEKQLYSLYEAANVPLRVDAQARALFFLLPEPGRDRYRLEAEARRLTHEPYEVGLFFGYADQPSKLGSERWYLSFSFLEQTPFRSLLCVDQQLTISGREKVSTRPAKELLRQRPWVSPQLPASLVGLAAAPLAGWNPQAVAPVLAAVAETWPVPAAPASTIWRQLAVEVGPREMRTFWDGKLFARIPLEALQQRADTRRKMMHRFDALDVLPPSPFAFTSRGGLGIYVLNGRAEFRNVVLKPLAPP